MLGIGVIGGGRICGAHATAAESVEETRLAAIAEIDPERLAKATERFGGRGYGEYRELLRDPQVDAVVVALPHFLHRQVTVECLEAGKHVLLEKPMAMDTAECDAMLRAAETADRTLMVAHIHHFFAANRELRRLVREGEIGAPVLATDTWYKPFWEGQRPPWFLDAAQGGGMWPMNGSHMIDRLTFFLGREAAAVKARVGSPVFGLSATDTGVAFLDFAGVPATIMHAGFREGVERFEAEIVGTEGHVRLTHSRAGRQLWRAKEGRWEETTVPGEEPPGTRGPSGAFCAQMREFALAVREGRPPEVPGEYGRYVVRVMQACEESSRLGREVVLPSGPER
jgi:phthalate 4,5-cis-dihydrodiol dehydrogenase